MPQTAVIDDRNRFIAFLATQPLCQWMAQKQREIDAGMHTQSAASHVHAPKPKDDNADLLAALGSMA